MAPTARSLDRDPLAVRRALSAALLAACAARTAPPAPAASPDVAALGWLRGRWCGPHDGGTFCETWRDAPGPSLRGDGAFARGGVRVFGEALSIEARGGDVYYVATPEGEGTTAFRLTRRADGEAVFENPAHDFPTRITYRREGDARMAVVVEGPSRRVTFAVARVE